MDELCNIEQLRSYGLNTGGVLAMKHSISIGETEMWAEK